MTQPSDASAERLVAAPGRGLAETLVQRLKDDVLAGTYSPGAKLPTEAHLAQHFGVSRTVVREAISRLAAEGMVESFQGKGTFIRALPEPTGFSFGSAQIRSHQDVLDVLEFRAGVESEAAALAARRRTDAQLRGIERALRAVQDGGIEADYEFHLKIAQASGNRLYADLVGSLGPMMIMLPRTRLQPEFTVSDATHLTRVTLEHESIYGAIALQESDAARAAMRTHLANSRARLHPTR